MIIKRPATERGNANFGWLNANYTFSFSRYYDPAHMGFSVLRVMNEDFVAPGKGFETHPHDNMEILTFVLNGTLEHRDSMGNGSQIQPGDFQLMSAGSGVTHSEFNPSTTEVLHLYQIWILPNVRDIDPSYQQRSFIDIESGEMRLIASAGGLENSFHINQDVKISIGKLSRDGQINISLNGGRKMWIQVVDGEIEIRDPSQGEGSNVPIKLIKSDGAGIQEEKSLSIISKDDSRFIVFDLP